MEEFKAMLKNGQHEFFLLFGVARSSKHINWDGEDTYTVFNEIDDTENVYTEKQFAERYEDFMKKSKFYAYV